MIPSPARTRQTGPKPDRPRKIDRYIDYFGTAGSGRPASPFTYRPAATEAGRETVRSRRTGAGGGRRWRRIQLPVTRLTGLLAAIALAATATGAPSPRRRAGHGKEDDR